MIGVEGVSEQSFTTSKKFVMTYLRHFMEICNMEFGFFGNGFITVLMATENRSKKPWFSRVFRGAAPLSTNHGGANEIIVGTPVELHVR